MLRRSRRLSVPLFAIAILVGACNQAPAADTPDGAVRQAFNLVDQGDIDGLLALTCAAQQDATREQFGFGQLSGATGLDLAPLFDALNVDQSGLAVTTKSIQGDQAEVHLGGTLGFSFDAGRLRELFRQLAEQQGVPVDDAMLDSMITMLQGTTQSLPLNQTVDVVREGGTWKLCSRLTLIG
jgi:hypothetical protein